MVDLTQASFDKCTTAGRLPFGGLGGFVRFVDRGEREMLFGLGGGELVIATGRGPLDAGRRRRIGR